MTRSEYERIQKIIDRKLDDYKKHSVCPKYDDAVESFAMILKGTIHREFGATKEDKNAVN